MTERKTTRRTRKTSTTSKKPRSAAKKRPAKKPTRKAAAKKPAKKSTPATSGLPTVSAHLSVDNAADAIEFYQKAFGALPRNLMTMPDGKLMHAELKIGDSVVMLADEMPGSPVKSPRAAGTTTNVLHITTDNVDRLWERATRAGAEILMPLEDQFWEQRYGQIKDPFGHIWALAQPVKMSKQEIEAKRRRAMEAMASTGGQPSEPRGGNGGRDREVTAW